MFIIVGVVFSTASPFHEGASTQRNDAVGMATFGFTIILALSVSAALAHDSFIGAVRNASKYTPRLAGVLLVLSGGYAIWDARYELCVSDGNRARDALIDAGTNLQTRFIVFTQSVRAERIALIILVTTATAYLAFRLRHCKVATLGPTTTATDPTPVGLTRNCISTMTRRADGELETDVLRALWALDRPASPSDVIDEMGTDLAYTSIATILGRLCEKGLATRKRAGRAYEYAAASSEADLTAQRLRSVLDATSDRQSALAGFAEALNPAEAAQLLALLNDTK